MSEEKPRPNDGGLEDDAFYVGVFDKADVWLDYYAESWGKDLRFLTVNEDGHARAANERVPGTRTLTAKLREWIRTEHPWAAMRARFEWGIEI